MNMRRHSHGSAGVRASWKHLEMPDVLKWISSGVNSGKLAACQAGVTGDLAPDPRAASRAQVNEGDHTGVGPAQAERYKDHVLPNMQSSLTATATVFTPRSKLWLKLSSCCDAAIHTACGSLPRKGRDPRASVLSLRLFTLSATNTQPHPSHHDWKGFLCELLIVHGQGTGQANEVPDPFGPISYRPPGPHPTL